MKISFEIDEERCDLVVTRFEEFLDALGDFLKPLEIEKTGSSLSPLADEIHAYAKQRSDEIHAGDEEMNEAERIAASLQTVGGPKPKPRKRNTKKITPAETAALNDEETAPPTKEELKNALQAYEARNGRPAKLELLRKHGAVDEDGKVHPKFLSKDKWAVVKKECE